MKPTDDWSALSHDERLALLQRLQRTVTRLQPLNGVVWADGPSEAAGDSILTLWNVTDRPSFDAYVDALRTPEFAQYFSVSVLGGDVSDVDAILRPFLES